MTDQRTPRTAAISQYRIDVLNHLQHESWCDWRTIGECGCDAGQMLITLIAVERAEAAELDVERLAKAYREHRRQTDADRLQEPCTPSCMNAIAAAYARLAAEETGDD